MGLSRPLLIASREPNRGPAVIASDLSGTVIVEGAIADQDEVVILGREPGQPRQECVATFVKGAGEIRLSTRCHFLQAHHVRASGVEVSVWVR